MLPGNVKQYYNGPVLIIINYLGISIYLLTCDALYHCALSFLQTGVMDSGSNNLQAMPFDILAVLLKLLLPFGFEAFYTFLKAWSQSERSNMIIRLLDSLPVRSLYKYGSVGTPADIAC